MWQPKCLFTINFICIERKRNSQNLSRNSYVFKNVSEQSYLTSQSSPILQSKKLQFFLFFISSLLKIYILNRLTTVLEYSVTYLLLISPEHFQSSLVYLVIIPDYGYPTPSSTLNPSVKNKKCLRKEGFQSVTV